MRQAAFELEDRLKEAQIDCRVSVPEKEIHLELDGEKTYRCLENLLTNVCKYALPGTRAYLNLYDKGDQVEIVLKNISRDELTMDVEELTERFMRGDKSRNTEGSGLGLAIVKRLTELMGGDIRLDSEPGQGSAFCVTLPIRPIPAPADGNIDDAGRILLVDTDPVVLTEGRQALESLGTEAYCAESVGEAVAYIRDRYQAGESCRMIIMDWEMLRPDAEEVLEQIRRETAGEPPLLIISAYDWSEIKDGWLAALPDI